MLYQIGVEYIEDFGGCQGGLSEEFLWALVRGQQRPHRERLTAVFQMPEYVLFPPRRHITATVRTRINSRDSNLFILVINFSDADL